MTYTVHRPRATNGAFFSGFLPHLVVVISLTTPHHMQTVSLPHCTGQQCVSFNGAAFYKFFELQAFQEGRWPHH